MRERVQAALPSLPFKRFLRFGSSNSDDSIVAVGDSDHALNDNVVRDRRTSPRTSPRLMGTGSNLRPSVLDIQSGNSRVESTETMGSSRYPLRNRIAISDTRHALVNPVDNEDLRQGDDVPTSALDQGRLPSTDTLSRQGSSRQAAETAKQRLKDSVQLWSGRYKQDKY
jgi:hypothetical protein